MRKTQKLNQLGRVDTERFATNAEKPPRLWIDGVLHSKPPRHLLIEIQRNGVLFEYGQHEGGPDGFRYVSPGGAIVVPYSFIDGELYILVVRQLRYLTRSDTCDGFVEGTPRGFYDGSVPAIEQARIEFEEEVGKTLDPKRIGELVALPGAPVCVDNGFVDIVNASGRGHHYFAIEIPEASLEQRGNDWQIRRAVVKPMSIHLAEEHITGHRFVKASELILSSDALNIVSVARLKQFLEMIGRI